MLNLAGLQSGALAVQPRPGFIARGIGDVGVVVVGLDLTLQQDGEPVTIPLRGTVFALSGEMGPRYVGGHYVASP